MCATSDLLKAKFFKDSTKSGLIGVGDVEETISVFALVIDMSHQSVYKSRVRFVIVERSYNVLIKR